VSLKCGLDVQKLSKAPSREGWRRIQQAGYGCTPYQGCVDTARTR